MLKLDVAMGASRLVTVAATALLSCCGSLSQGQPQSADAVVRAYARALGEGELEAAYARMSPEYRKHVGFQTWRKHVTENPREVSEAVRRLARVRSQADVRTLQQGRGTTPLQLVQQAGHWYIAAEPIEFYDQSSPRAALRSFVSAFRHKRYDVILRLTPEADKEGVTTKSLSKSFGHAARDDIARLLSQLIPSVQEPIEIDGEHATMPYAEHRHMQFVLQRGRWRIEEAQ